MQHAAGERDTRLNTVEPPVPQKFIVARTMLIGASLSEPHINGTAMCTIYGICMVHGTSVIRAPLHRLCIGPHAIFCAESLRSKTTATACSNLAHLCNISLMVSHLSEAMHYAIR